jgi:predicted phage-related endonuclease
MAIEIHNPSSRDEWLSMRKNTIGASEVACLFGEHPFLTPYQLFMQKTGRVEKKFAETVIKESSIHLPPTERGNVQEASAFELLGKLRPTWQITPNQIPGGRFFVDSETRMSSTPDAFLIDPAREGGGTVQVKTVASLAFDKGWKDEDKEVQFPTYVGIQATVDAALSGCSWACASAMVSNFGIDLFLVDVPIHAKLMQAIRAKVKDFWRRVAEDDPPPPDYSKDGKTLASLYADSNDSEIELTGDRIVTVLAAREELKKREADGADAAKQRKVYDAEIIHILGNAERGRLPDGRIVSAKTTRRGAYHVAETSFRTVRVKGPR